MLENYQLFDNSPFFISDYLFYYKMMDIFNK